MQVIYLYKDYPLRLTQVKILTKVIHARSLLIKWNDDLLRKQHVVTHPTYPAGRLAEHVAAP
jgi:hypothetical protein